MSDPASFTTTTPPPHDPSSLPNLLREPSTERTSTSSDKSVSTITFHSIPPTTSTPSPKPSTSQRVKLPALINQKTPTSTTTTISPTFPLLTTPGTSSTSTSREGSPVLNTTTVQSHSPSDKIQATTTQSQQRPSSASQSKVINVLPTTKNKEMEMTSTNTTKPDMKRQTTTQALGLNAGARGVDSQRRPGDRFIRIHGGITEIDESVPFVNDNNVITSKYTLLTFIPHNLFEQFLNLANLYFLFVGILQIIPDISTTNGNPTMYQPLAFIVAVSAARAAKEDYDKHQADNARNRYQYKVLQPSGEFADVASGDLKVGHIVKVMQNDMIPADMLFLGSAFPKGHCFIDKANLNGETTLEVMNSIIPTRPFCGNDAEVSRLQMNLSYEPPNKRFDSFRGFLTVEDPHSELPIDGKSLLMRETNLKNCEYIYGLVVYNGNDTKIQKSNSEGEKVKLKVSQIMRKVNKYLIIMALFQLILCFIGGVIAGTYRDHQTSDMWFLRWDITTKNARSYSGPVFGILAFFSWFILLSQMVPISLIVSNELVKFTQSRFIQWDTHLFYEPINKPAKCNSSTIHEDLGLIDFIFSDKTGTLTQNKMQFRYLLLNIGEWGSAETDIAKSVKNRQKELEEKASAGQDYIPPTPTPWTKLVKPLLPKRLPRDNKRGCCFRHFPRFMKWFWDNPDSYRQLNEDTDAGISIGNTFTSQERDALLRSLWGPPEHGETHEQWQYKKQILRQYMIHMALSNTVKPYDDKGELKFQAESAEELAMTMFARSCGFTKKSINPTVLEIEEYDEQLKSKKIVIEKYLHVATFGFTSKRARVTVVYQRLDGPQADSIMIMSKGQDSVMLPLMNTPGEDLLLNNLRQMSTNGLRTLVCGHGERDYDWWASRQDAYQAMIERDTTSASEGHPDKCKRDACEKCAAHYLFEQTEKDADLQYLGCVGMEDQLQLLVPDTIRDCLRADIKVWMITGDKLETAKNIGLACNLIDPDMQAQLRPGMTLDAIVKEYGQARLIEITGQWSALTDNEEEVGKLFDGFSANKGVLNRDDLSYILESLHVSVSPDKLDRFYHDLGSGASGQITRPQFINMMKQTKLTKIEAVRHDVEEGWKIYDAIQDHATYPISILVDRAAFQVMFPGKKDPKVKPDPQDALIDQQLEQLRSRFFGLAAVAKSLVFSRAEPAMKKKMVTEIQARVPTAVTLAIGDGANDTDMITAAHVGVGIAGVEGTAATNSADYAIGTFRMLHTLLFVHGFWSYKRISTLVNFIFYKASFVALCMYIFGFFSAFSGQQFYNDPPYQLYNVMYTALPILILAVFDQEIKASMLEDYPQAYREARGRNFTPLIFIGWIFRAVLHTIIVSFVCWSSTGQVDIITTEGRTGGIWFYSSVVYYCVAIIPNFLIIFDMNIITLIHVIAIALSIAAIYLVTFIINVLLLFSVGLDLYGIIDEMYASANAWFTIILCVVMIMSIELCYRGMMREFFPNFTQILQEFSRLPPRKRQDTQIFTQSLENLPSPASRDHNTPLETAPLSNDITKSSMDEPNHESHGLQLKHSLVRAMLRFRNLTGAQFDSCAEARYQRHDAPSQRNSHTLPVNPQHVAISSSQMTSLPKHYHESTSPITTPYFHTSPSQEYEYKHR